MKQISVRLSGEARSCLVDTGDLQAWGKALLDEILFEAAKQVSAAGDATPASVALTFAVDTADVDTLVVKYLAGPAGPAV